MGPCPKLPNCVNLTSQRTGHFSPSGVRTCRVANIRSTTLSASVCDRRGSNHLRKRVGPNCSPGYRWT